MLLLTCDDDTEYPQQLIVPVLGGVPCPGVIFQSWGLSHSTATKCGFLLAMKTVFVPMGSAALGSRLSAGQNLTLSKWAACSRANFSAFLGCCEQFTIMLVVCCQLIACQSLLQYDCV